MKICTIIAEYNAFHNGHKRLVDFAKGQCDTVIAIMSGNFTQRAMPACAEKYTRAKHAVMCGVDAVIELPTIYATASAKNFAKGAVSINNLINADYIAFGSEDGNIDRLIECSQHINQQATNQLIKNALKKGLSYPKAISYSLPQFAEILEKPNNTLAIEYLNALQESHSLTQPLTIRRQDNYNNDDIIENFASATALRNMDKAQAKLYAPDFVVESISNTAEVNYKKFASTFMSIITPQELKDIEGITEGIENKFAKAQLTQDYQKFIDSVKSKRYTQLKLQRIILNTILGITKELSQKSMHIVPQIKLLAVNKQRTDILSHIDSCTAQVNQDIDILSQMNSITQKADKLYYALTDCTVKSYLQKI